MLPSVVLARTWYVEKDGSGDYEVIQDAVDVAASGDTIRIGPGRYDDKRLVTCPGWSDSVRILVTQSELTVIGSGSETIVGPNKPWASDRSLGMGVVASDWWGNSTTRLHDLRMENIGIAIYYSYEGSGNNLIEIDNCVFDGNRESAYLDGNGGDARIEACTFESLAESGYYIAAWSQASLSIQECTFSLSDDIYGQTCFSIMGVENASIISCEISEGTVGATVSFGGQTTFRGCTFDGQLNVALSASVASSVSVNSCTFRNQACAVTSSSSDNLFIMSNTLIENVTVCSFLVQRFGAVSVNNCDLAKGDRGVVWVSEEGSCPSIEHLDFTNNYWDTDRPDSIQAWIRDRNDTENACYIIDWEPYSDVPLPSKKKSFGGLKAMFRGR